MSLHLPDTPDFLTGEVAAFLPRVSVHDARAIEVAMAGQDLWHSGVEIRAALVEASFARSDPPLLRRLSEAGVPYLVDPQTLRFATSAYQEVGRMRALPYAPKRPLTPSDATDPDIDRLARGSLSVQQAAGAAAFMAPTVPLYDSDVDGWLTLHRRLLETSAALNGRAGFDRKPLVAFLAPGRRLSMNPDDLVEGLADLPLAGVYVQPLRLNPTGDSIEKLVLYARLLVRIREIGLPVIAGRVGSFGLLLQAIGIGLFDSGLGEAERFDLASLTRSRHVASTDASGSGARGDRRIYLERLKTTLRGRHALAVLSEVGLRSNFVCNLGCCRFRSIDDLADRRRQHYLWVRSAELDDLAAQRTRQLRIEHVSQLFAAARETASVVRRSFEARDLDAPNFEHLERWGAVLTRLSSAPVGVA